MQNLSTASRAGTDVSNDDSTMREARSHLWGFGRNIIQGGGQFNTSLNVQATHPSFQITNIAIYFFIFLLSIIDTIILPHLQSKTCLCGRACADSLHLPRNIRSQIIPNVIVNRPSRLVLTVRRPHTHTHMRANMHARRQRAPSAREAEIKQSQPLSSRCAAASAASRSL